MSSRPDALLRRSLRANAVFSIASGIVLLVADGLVAALLQAYEHLGLIHLVGAGVLLFGIGVYVLSRREALAPGAVIAVIAADLAWVVASWLAIGLGATPGQGGWAVGLVADVVLLFAILQAIGLRRLQRSATASA